MNDTLNALDMAESLLYALPTRARIAGIPKAADRHVYKIRVDRSMPFEFIANLTPAFCGLWKSDVRFDYSDYDAALSGIGGNHQADAYIIWLDWRIYSQSMTAQEAVDWLNTRITQLRGATDKPIWVNNWPQLRKDGDLLFGHRVSGRDWFLKLNGCLAELMERSAGCELIDLDRLAQEEAESFYDERNEDMSHFPLSDRATITVARHLGVHLFPAAFAPRLKAIALDMDDTLYSGVLGEDGIDGVVLSEGHCRLQKLLLRLKQSGMLLTVCSRNEERDARALFDGRDDFPLKWNDFAAVYANWQPKSENLSRLAQQLNIDPSAFLFLDDNSAELLKMAAALPDVRLFRASRSGMETMNGLSHYPGLYQFRPDDEASSRTADIQANQARERTRQAASSFEDYLESLKMVVSLYENEPSHAGRLYDLSRKTNQFNLAMRRMTEIEAKEAMDKDRYLTVTVRLSDLLADSGIIGVFVCRLEGEQASLIETLFSCRALGREIETVAFAKVLKKLIAKGVKRLSIDRIEGPRNGPALDWLKRYVPDSGGSYLLRTLHARVNKACRNHPAEIEVIP
ncbi:HAD-IIIC family phosphatase [Paenibacillus mendelii]|uniref:HAD-IIIC family phosphatase n=1 Tax=Paenibacillus mendelii TaxID=206163 RepID=A0ABV6J905_9BACL|nr:HAD-IIIC family phosphatase [Paenibacillus mendelii]MCQ6559705.1 HAD-IIIC family phosphatase [Paenibacillus mendelii]